MMNRFFKLSAVLPILVLACAAESNQTDSSASASETTPTLPAPAAPIAGTHVGVHGMNLFGSGGEKMYLSHIPLYSNPHNLQVVVEVKIATGVPVDQQLFATKNFTVRPTAFSLGDLSLGTLPSIMGTIYLGNFESGGTPAFRNVKFDVGRVIHQHAMSNMDRINPSLEYIAVGTPNQSFLVHLIDANPSFDQIIPFKVAATAAPGFLTADTLESGTMVKIANRTNKITTRLADLSTVDAVRTIPAPPVENDGGDAAAPGPVVVTAQIELGKEVACLPGPDFYGTCPRVAAPPTPPTP